MPRARNQYIQEMRERFEVCQPNNEKVSLTAADVDEDVFQSKEEKVKYTFLSIFW